MLSRITAALAARKNALKDKDEKGFTLIELLVVVIIIGVLAAIAIPIYIGVQDNAKDSAVKSDLTNAKIAVVAYQTENAALPDGTTAGQKLDPADTELGNYGFTASEASISATTGSSTIAFGTATGAEFCIQATSVTGHEFHVTDSSGVTGGLCS